MDNNIIPLHGTTKIAVGTPEGTVKIAIETPEEREAFERLMDNSVERKRLSALQRRQYAIDQLAAVIRTSPTTSAEAIATLLYDAGCELPEPNSVA